MAIAGLALTAPSAWALSPAVSSRAATNVDYTTATFNGTVNPNGLATKIYFEYGPTTSYGSKTAEESAGAGSSSLEWTKAVTGLTANTTYHYRVVAVNADGTSTGGDRTFTVGWKVESLSETGTQMKDVSCTSPSACTAVQDGGIQRWNGTEWKAQTLATPAGGGGVTAEGVSCSSASACTAVGNYNVSGASKTLAEFWNGTEWKVQTTPTPAGATFVRTRSVSCLTENECTAVGSYGTGETKTFAMRWNGTEWSLQTTVNPSKETYLTSVSCPTSSFCMAAGFYYDTATAKWIPHAQRWDGTEWSTQAPVKPAGANISWLYGVSCVSASACWGVGPKEVDAGTHETQTMVQFWNGSSWVVQTSPNPEASNRDLEDVSCTSSTACTAVGHLTAGSGFLPFSLKWNGSSWAVQNMPLASGSAKAMIFSTSCILSRGCVAVGQKWNAASEVVRFAEDNWRAAMPTVTTTAATAIGEKSATINGTVNPNGSETKAYFEYGTTTGYGSKTAEVNLGSGTGAVAAEAALTGLSPATTYHYRAVANNENPETSRGGDQTFRTTGPPTVSVFTADDDLATGEAATLTGSVNPNGLSTTYQFEYGTSSGVYTNTVPASPESAGSGTESKSVSYKVTGLTRGKTYYYRLTATNAAAKANSTESSFTTAGPPVAQTSGAIAVTRKCATVEGSVLPKKLLTKYWFEYGTTTSYGAKIPVTPKEVSGTVTSKSVSETPCGLTANTLYHFRLVAENAFGTSIGEDQMFTTRPATILKAKGSLLGVGAPMKASGSTFTFSGGEWGTVSCPETEFSGEVTENPGATQSVTAIKMQKSGGNCSASSGLFIKYVIPPQALTFEYTNNKLVPGLGLMSTFTYVASSFLAGFQTAECEYSLQLTGTYALKTPLTLTLSGSSLLLKTISGSCPNGQSASGTFAVTSSGVAVEAEN